MSCMNTVYNVLYMPNTCHHVSKCMVLQAVWKGSSNTAVYDIKSKAQAPSARRTRSGKPQRDDCAEGRKSPAMGIDTLTEGRCVEPCRQADRQLTQAVASNGEVRLIHEASLSPILTDFHPVNV